MANLSQVELNGTTYDLKDAPSRWLLSPIAGNIAGKKVSIIGDSISTYNQTGYKYGSYRTYYPNTDNTPDVDSVDKTWWKQVLDITGATIEVNASYAGSCVTNIKASSGYPDLYDRCTTTILGSPDIIFIVLGTNDSNNEVDIGTYNITATYTTLSEATFANAYIKGVKALQAIYPNALIYCISLRMDLAYAYAIKLIAERLGCNYIYAGDYLPTSGSHPDAAGMKKVALNVLAANSEQSQEYSKIYEESMFCKNVRLTSNAQNSFVPSSDSYTHGFLFGMNDGSYNSRLAPIYKSDGSHYLRFMHYSRDHSKNNTFGIGYDANENPLVEFSAQGKLAWLKSLLAPTELSVTLASPLPTGISSIGAFKVYRSGYMIHVVCDITLSATMSTANTSVFVTLPAPMRTDAITYFAPVVDFQSNVNSIGSKALLPKIYADGRFAVTYGYAGRFLFTIDYLTSADP